MVGYLGSGSRASRLTEGLTLAGPGFLLLLLTLGNMVVARGTFSENMERAVIVSVKVLSWVHV